MIDSLVDDDFSSLSPARRGDDESPAAATVERATPAAVGAASPDSLRRVLDLARRALRARESAILEVEEPASVHATLATPIVAGGAAAGSLVVRDDAQRRWSDDDRAMLHDLAALLAAEIGLTGEIERLRAEIRATDTIAAAGRPDEAVGSPIETTAADVPVSAEPEPFNILLADDLDLNRKLISDMLSIDGYAVDSVADGAAAVEAVKLKSYDLVLMDMIMPGMDGVEAARAIRALPAPTCDVPIVALTAHSFREQLDNCLDAGMNDTLIKPMSFDALSAAVAAWVRPRQQAA